MAIYGYNFNSSSTAAQMKQKGWNTFDWEFATAPILSWNTYSVVGYGQIISPPLPAAVSIVRIKYCFTLGALGGDCRLLELYDSNLVKQLTFEGLSTGAIAIYRPSAESTILKTSNAGLLSVNAAYNLEVLVKIDDTNGYIKCWINSVLVDELSFAGDTKYTSNANVQFCGIYRGNSAMIYWHDLIIDDAPSDTIIGNQYVMTQRPASVVSKSADITTSDSSDPAALLATSAPVGTPYVQFPTAGDALTVSFTALPVNIASVSAVNVTADWSKATDSSYGAGDVNARLDFTVGGTTVTGSAPALANGFVGHSENLTGVMTLADVNAMTATITRTV